MLGNIEVILVDIGNSAIKSAEVSDGHLEEIKKWNSIDELKQAYPIDIPYMVCSTTRDFINLDNSITLSHLTPLPIKLDYKTPETLGTDRIAAAVGAFDKFPDQNSLVIDVGTCMTMDLISKNGTFLGGIISPGLDMRMKSMSHFTANLPDISEELSNIEVKTLGQSTKECLLAGAAGGMLNEIQGVLQTLRKEFTSINVILTGGDAHHFESKVKAHIFAGSKIVLVGLYRIWNGLHKKI